MKKINFPGLDISHGALQELRNPLIGATVVSIREYPRDEMLGELMDLLPGFKTPQEGSLESNYTFRCLPVGEDSIWTQFSRLLASELNRELTSEFGRVEFDDLYLTRYFEVDKEGALGVGPHRDTNCKGIVAALILKGCLPAFVCQEKDLSGPVSFAAETGEILLMRAEVASGAKKPLHYVGNIGRRSVIQFGMRQYVNKPEKGGK